MSAPLLAEGEQQLAALGDCPLESGEVIRDCQLGYRTYGVLDADRANAMLVPTWFTGTSEEAAAYVGPGKLFDSSKLYVIAVDAFANGVSSSPSNSTSQPRMMFPRITIRDMVNAQQRLLTDVLDLRRLRSVAGISMGAMQAFEWAVAYPELMETVIAISGSPRLAPYDLLDWQARIDAIRGDPDWNHGDYREQPARRARYALSRLLSTTPALYNSITTREQALAGLEAAERGPAFDANDTLRQAEAMMSLDVSRPFGGSLERAAARVRARMLVIVSTTDHVVTPGPARELAELAGARLLALDSDCGHLLFDCDSEELAGAIAAFLDN